VGLLIEERVTLVRGSDPLSPHWLELPRSVVELGGIGIIPDSELGQLVRLLEDEAVLL